MKIKTIIVSVLVLAALSVVAFLARRPAPPPSSDARIDQSLVDRAAVEKTVKLRFSDAGKKIELVRQSDGTWRVPSYYDLPADFGKLSGFIGTLTDAKLQRLVKAADSIAVGDVYSEYIRNRQAWALLPSLAVANVRAATFAATANPGMVFFPAWLGKNSSRGKRARLLAELVPLRLGPLRLGPELLPQA